MHHKIVFLDLDGTVNSSSIVRNHLIPSMPQYESNWAAWHVAHIYEKPNQAVIEVVRALKATGWTIILLSMRGDQCVDSTIEQLDKWGVPFDSYTLKSVNDNRHPGTYKKDEIMAFLVAAHHMKQYVDVLVIDDSPEVHKAVRDITSPKGVAHINVLEVTPFKG